MEQLIGELLGDRTNTESSARYRIKALLGKQTGRRTFLAEDTQTERSVVVKLVLFGPDFTWEDLRLFEREAKTLKSLNHPAIPKYLDSFEVETPLGQGFAMVQAYIEAKSLQMWVGEGATFSEEESRAIALELLSILKYLHHRQPPIIHRDIKPSNILLTAPSNGTIGKLYLIDFGSVQTTCASSTMTIAGTYGYMPPEQFGGRAQPASDLYSVGATLIYLATGKHPAELTQANLQIDFDDSHLSPSFSRWLKQLTYADLERRTTSATRAIQQLKQNNISDKDKFKDDASGSTSLRNDSSVILKSTLADLTVGTNSQRLVVQLSETRTRFKEYSFKEYSSRGRHSPRRLFSKPSDYVKAAHALAIFSMLLFMDPLVDLILKLGVVREPMNELIAVIIGFIYYGIVVTSTFVVSSILLGTFRKQKMCRLELYKEANNTLVSLTSIYSDQDTGWITIRSAQNDLPLLQRATLHSTVVANGIFRDKVRMMFSEVGTKNISRLDICGSRQEIKWLSEHLRRQRWIDLKDRWNRPLTTSS